MQDDELDEGENDIRWRWREASGALFLTIAAIVLIVLVAVVS
jgi:hypothetical protein